MQYYSHRQLPTLDLAATIAAIVLILAFPRPSIAAQTSPFPPQQIPVPALPQAVGMTADSFDVEAYTLGAGDRLRVEVFGVPEYGREYQVLVNGSLNLVQVSPVSVRGLTLKQAEAAIAQRYARLVKRVSVDVTLLLPRPINVAIAGEVSRPGAYKISLGETTQLPTLTQLLQQAGGISQSGDPQQVILRRPQANGNIQTFRLDLLDLAQTGNLNQNPILRDGDMVQVIERSTISPEGSPLTDLANFATDVNQPLNIAVVGEVNRPGTYVLANVRPSGQANNLPTGIRPTLTQALQQAGGITQIADIRGIEVRRKTNSGQVKKIALDLSKLLDGDISQDLILQQNDTIVIPTATTLSIAEASKRSSASFSPSSVRINVVGEVERPGTIEVVPNTTLNQAILASGGFNRRAKNNSVELLRLNPNGSMTKQSIAINLAQGIDIKNNPILQNNDIIIVDRSGGTKFSDSLDAILSPLGRILPFGFLFRR
jgi:polysaccharide biosynthesis/export protein